MPKDLTKTTADVPATIDWSQDLGHGHEFMDAGSTKPPFISVLQGLSPQCERLTGAKPGMFHNSVTDELYTQIRVVQCHFRPVAIRWAPRGQGGGYKGEYSLELARRGKLPGQLTYEGRWYADVPAGQIPVDAEGKPKFDHYVQTHIHYFLVQSASGSWQWAIMPLRSTQLSLSSKMNTALQLLNVPGVPPGKLPPSYSAHFLLKTAKVTKESNSWFVIDPVFEQLVSDPTIIDMARQYYKSVNDGQVVATEQPLPEDVGF